MKPVNEAIRIHLINGDEVVYWEDLRLVFSSRVINLFKNFMQGRIFYIRGPLYADVVAFLEKVV
jgi:hypothetical protein